MNDHEIGLQERIEACAGKNGGVALNGSSEKAIGKCQAHEVHEAKAPGVDVDGPAWLREAASARAKPPATSIQATSATGLHERPALLQNDTWWRFFSSEGCDVYYRGVVDQNRTSKGGKGRGHGQMKNDGKHRLVLVKPWLEQEPCGGAEANHIVTPTWSTGDGRPSEGFGHTPTEGFSYHPKNFARE